MKPYGVRVEEWPDVGDIKIMGAKSCVGKLRGKSGLYRGYCRGSWKKHIRRYWKRRARREGRREICRVMMEYLCAMMRI